MPLHSGRVDPVSGRQDVASLGTAFSQCNWGKTSRYAMSIDELLLHITTSKRTALCRNPPPEARSVEMVLVIGKLYRLEESCST